eukprot:CAMPEP_0203959790 /NCGR_PEP_ID=MMETSP0359-20131031/90728_1 /ASSEMBLY_ACC=CAM_ASM_000338 /TAXON_ID=268821 /ORGANISM="Scrippsiella Hangoei, Strain SHTV-5" /LENGTH=34 /DNA_ID= /DNA_START= /DNA_END= /DNA_ORIENTATION=
MPVEPEGENKEKISTLGSQLLCPNGIACLQHEPN